MIATLDRLKISISDGMVSANNRVTRSAVSVRSSLASANRCCSCSVRTNARITRIPARFSRSTPLIRSIFTCMTRNSGTIFDNRMPITTAITGMMTNSRADSSTSVRTAMITPPTAVNGAAIIMVRPMSTSICTCCTSLVVRVISDGAPNSLTSLSENCSTLRKRLPRTSRPNAIAVRALKYTAITEITASTSERPSMNAPTRTM